MEQFNLVNRTGEAGLNRWELCSNEISMIIQEFENELDDCDEDEEYSITSNKYQEDTFLKYLFINCIATSPVILSNKMI